MCSIETHFLSYKPKAQTRYEEGQDVRPGLLSCMSNLMLAVGLSFERAADIEHDVVA